MQQINNTDSHLIHTMIKANIRPSSGNNFIRSLLHCALIEYHSFSYVFEVFFISFLKCSCFSVMYNTCLINIILLLIFGYTIFVYLSVVFLYLRVSLVCCFLECVYQASLFVLCIDFGVIALAYVSF
jgi:hypothetical protein